jgi:hypothetical protein
MLSGLCSPILDTVTVAPPGSTPNLDRWLSSAAVRTRHRRTGAAAPEALWREAGAVRLRDCRLLGRVVRARLGVRDPEITFEALFRTAPFVLLEGGPTWALSGLCGRIWSTRRELAQLSGPQAFSDWREPGTARVLFAHWVEPRPAGGALHSEVRVSPVDRRAARNLQALRPLISAFQGLIGVECLALAVRRAEAA